jgi:hypothetical protein
MTTNDGSFEINLESLTAFAEELKTQLSGMVQPLGQLTSLTEGAVRLGEFNEAHSLRDNHGVAVGEMQVLVGQARDAIEFAKDITRTVSDAYEHYDDHLTGALSTVGTAIGGTVAGVAGTVTSTVDGVLDGVTGLLGGGSGDEKA